MGGGFRGTTMQRKLNIAHGAEDVHFFEFCSVTPVFVVVRMMKLCTIGMHQLTIPYVLYSNWLCKSGGNVGLAGWFGLGWGTKFDHRDTRSVVGVFDADIVHQPLDEFEAPAPAAIV